MLARQLTAWFKRAQRAMPWRKRPTPYSCWLSEIMLQQTTYEQALPYYERFLARFPAVEDLAAANEQDVLAAWAGLGYYARARNLHAAAKAIVAQGTWPQTSREWGRLPGIGPYTAAALASVLAGEAIPVVDGNVARVFARHWHLADDFRKLPAREQLAARLKKELFAHVGRTLLPGDLNQAMMELGALVCTPKAPQCAACPLRKTCAAFKAGDYENYPQRAARKALPVRAVTACITTDDQGRVLLVRNTEGGLLKGLWELPTLTPAGEHTQVFSHFKLALTLQRTRAGAVFVDPRQVPLTTATRKVLVQTGLLENPA